MSLEVSDNISEVNRVLNPFDLRQLFRHLETLRSAAPGDDDPDDPDDPGDDDDKLDDDGSGGTGAGSDKDDKSVTDPDKKRLSDEAAKWRRLRREEREAKEALAARVAELEGKDKSEAEKLKADVESLTEKLTEAQERASARAKRVAIADAVVGKNVKDLKYLEFLLDQEKDVEYEDEDGEVADVSEHVEAILKRHPSLVATSGDEDDDDDAKVASGRRTDGKDGKKSKGDLDFDALAKKFPALARR